MRLGKGSLICLLLLTALAAISPILAQGYSITEDDVELRFNYPTEIKLGSCVTINFWMKAKSNLTDLDVRLTITYHADSYTRVIYDETIVSETSVTRGWTTSKSINLCIPPAEAPEPHLQALVEISYKVDGSPLSLEHDWFMSIVRSETYEELENQLDKAEEDIRRLHDRIGDLKDEIKYLKNQLAEKDEEIQALQERYDKILKEYLQLKNRYEEVQKSYDDLNAQYKDLEKRYDELRDKHQSALLDLERLRTKYDLLLNDYGKLDENYRSLLKDYQSTLSDLKAYKSMYQDLKARHEDLEKRHQESLIEEASLRQRISDLERDYGTLSKMYQSTLGENLMAKNIIFAQAAAVAAGAAIYILISRRISRGSREPVNGEAGSNGNSRRKVQKILSGRRVTIPSDVAGKLGLKEGDRVQVEFGDDHIVIRPIREEPQPHVEGQG